MKNQLSDDLFLDKYDVALLRALQKDASTSHQQLSAAVGLSTSQVSRRISRLHSNGVIQRTVALIDPICIGLNVRAICYVTLHSNDKNESDAFEREIANLDEVLECFAVTGETDYILQLVATNLGGLSESVLQRLTSIKSVSSIRSSIVLQRIKNSTELPLKQIER